MDYTAELKKIETANQEAKINKAKYEQKLEQLEEEKNKILAQLEEKKISVKDLDETIENLRVEIENELAEAKESLS